MELLVATTNAGKVRELEQILAPLGVDLRTPKDFPLVAEAVEDGTTFEENALKKARHWYEATGLAVIADDSGLCIDALDGEPGVLSARYAPTTEERNAKVLEKLRDVPANQRTARFVCAVVFIDEKGQTVIDSGTCEGVIHDEPVGEGGFGYDPIFWVTAQEKTMAQLGADLKNTISHRGNALAKVRSRLETWAGREHHQRREPKEPDQNRPAEKHFLKLRHRKRIAELRWGTVVYGIAAMMGLAILMYNYGVDPNTADVNENLAQRSVAVAIKWLLGLLFLINGVRGVFRCQSKLREIK